MLELPPKVDFWLPPKPAIIRPAPDKRASFMPGMFPAGAIAAGAVVALPELSFLQAAEDTGNLTNYSFVSQNIGVAHSARRVVAGVTWGDSTQVRSLNGITIAGVAATIHVQVSNGNATNSAICSALVPAGTSGTIDLALSGEADRASIALYRAVNETSTSPHATATDDSSASGLLTTSINIPANGWVIAALSYNTTTGQTFIWSGVTNLLQTVFADAAGVYRGAAMETGLVAQTGRTVSAQCSNTGSANGRLAVMSWG